MPKANAAPRADAPQPDSEHTPADPEPADDATHGPGPDGEPHHAPDRATEAAARPSQEHADRSTTGHKPPEADGDETANSTDPHREVTDPAGIQPRGGDGEESAEPAAEESGEPAAEESAESALAGGVHTTENQRAETERRRAEASEERTAHHPEAPAEEVTDAHTPGADGKDPEEPSSPQPRYPAPAHHRADQRARTAGRAHTTAGTEGHTDTAPDAEADAERDAEPETEPETAPPPRLTPRQARGIRAAISTVVMLAVAVALAARLNSTPSVLTVGFYGMALVLSGTAVVLSRRGRTRVATGALLAGFTLVIFAEQLLPSGE